MPITPSMLFQPVSTHPCSSMEPRGTQMKLSTAGPLALLFASLAWSSSALADDLFLFTDESSRLPSDAAENAKDTLDVELADIDADGDLDLFVIEGSASAAGFQNMLWINDGSGNYIDDTDKRMPAVANNSTEIDLADVDDDGDLDAVVANLGATELLINDGSGYFSMGVLPSTLPPGPPGFMVPFPPFFTKVSAEALFTDIDGDGDQDIVVSNENPFPQGPPGDANEILINDGRGNFEDQSTRLPFTIDNTSGIAPGDIDADGDTDLVIGNIGQNKVYINDGAGNFGDETAARLPVLIDSTRKIVLGDMDGDGDLDLVAGNSRSEQNRLYVNDGTGVFTDATAGNLPDDSTTTTDIDIVDLDNDGSLDIFVTNVGDFVFNHGFLGEPNRVYLNNGDGSFKDVTFPRLAARDGRSTNADLGDVNGDGVMDVVIANSGGASQPGLPPPDGAERLFIRQNCKLNTTLCHQTMIDDLNATIISLNTVAFPDGDMSSRHEKLNRFRKRLLEFRASRAQTALDADREVFYAARLLQIVKRADGKHYPRDWVDGTAARRINGYGRFSLNVLHGFGL